MDSNSEAHEFSELCSVGDANRYQVLSIVGRGSYGVVCKAWDRKNKIHVAIKRIDNAFNQLSSGIQVLREMKFLRMCASHDNIVTLVDVLAPESAEHSSTVFLVFEYMPGDLHRLLVCSRSGNELTSEHIRFITYQLVRGLVYIHALNVVHRDLKPSNILINQQCSVRICDFGMARAAFEPENDFVFWTDYVATRWYRAPELILTSRPKYNGAIDMWALGCIFAELLNGGEPLFPGKTFAQQIELMISKLGRPPDRVLQQSDARIRALIDAVRPVQGNNAQTECFTNISDPLARDLLAGLLHWAPLHRLTATQALQHAYFSSIHQPAYEVIPRECIQRRECIFEGLSLKHLKLEYLREVIHYYHPEHAALLNQDDLRALERTVVHRLTRLSQLERFASAMKLKELGSLRFSQHVSEPKRKPTLSLLANKP